MSNPFNHIQESIQAAEQAADPNAGLLFLATCSEDGQPSVRTLLLRKMGERSLLILFSKHHGKWRDLEENQRYEVLLWYPSIGHQYRLRGSFHLAEHPELLECWNEQPTSIKRVDLSYGGEFVPGSPCHNMAEFHSQVGALPEEQAQSAPPPEHVVAAWLSATYVERVATSPDRLHERTQYKWSDQSQSWYVQKVIP